MKAYLIITGLLLLFAKNLAAQNNCSVAVDSLKGQYNGDCKNGKAHGTGTAVGINSYTGNFKNGYPDGNGKYTWQNGSWYQGSWKNGNFDGQGTLCVKSLTEADSIITTGFWKKGKYIGQYEKPYTSRALTSNVSDVNIHKGLGLPSSITIVVKNVSGGGASISSTNSMKPHLADLQLLKGKFDQRQTDESSSPGISKYVFTSVSFPFSATLSFEVAGSTMPIQKIIIELYETNSWEVMVNINN